MVWCQTTIIVRRDDVVDGDGISTDDDVLNQQTNDFLLKLGRGMVKAGQRLGAEMGEVVHDLLFDLLTPCM